MTTNQKKFYCVFENCNKSFASNAALQVHLNRHNNIRPFKCTICNRAFFRKANLTEHIKNIHTGENKMTCERCRKVYACKKTFDDHTCAIEEELKCGKCNKRFSKLGFKDKHMRDKHGSLFRPKTISKCSICSLEYANYSSFKSHIVNIHNGFGYKCDVCDARFRLLKEFKAHACQQK
ncbi:ZBT24 [Hepatospora eriocheir]|uniref:ZBT24 n=1 Tax=Hepatospora eriocheir TaxID=1081669 RepID=A0A1X0QA05_9MICR|nr:ZBT24 [Hepatospora eriocheir]